MMSIEWDLMIIKFLSVFFIFNFSYGLELVFNSNENLIEQQIAEKNSC